MFDVSNLESIEALETGDLLIILRKDSNGIADILQYDISKIVSPTLETSIWSFGPYAPSPLENPNPNSYYLNTTTGQIFTTITTSGTTTWNQNSIMTLTGPKGDDGAAGESAYQIAVDNGYTGTQSQWLASLKGSAGEDGTRVYFVYSVPTGVISDSRGNCRPGDYAIVSLDGTDVTSSDTSIGETYVYDGAGTWTGPLTTSLATRGPAGPAPILESSDTITISKVTGNTYEVALTQKYLNLDASNNVNQVIDQGQNIMALGLKNNDSSEVFMGVNLINNSNTLEFISAGKTSLLLQDATGLTATISPDGSSFDTGTITTNGSGTLTASAINSGSFLGLTSLTSDPLVINPSVYVHGGTSNILKFYDGSAYHKIILDTDLDNKISNYALLSGDNTFTGKNTFSDILGDASDATANILYRNTDTGNFQTMSVSLSNIGSLYKGYKVTASTANYTFSDTGTEAGQILSFPGGGSTIAVPTFADALFLLTVYGSQSQEFSFNGFTNSGVEKQTVTLNTGDMLILYGSQYIDSSHNGYFYQIIRSGFDGNNVSSSSVNFSSADGGITDTLSNFMNYFYNKTLNLSDTGSYTGDISNSKITLSSGNTETASAIGNLANNAMPVNGTTITSNFTINTSSGNELIYTPDGHFAIACTNSSFVLYDGCADFNNMFISSSVSENLSSSGTSITDALTLTSVTNVVTTTPSGSGVKLPNVILGCDVYVLNRGTTNILVYPESTTSTIENLDAGAGQNLLSGGTAHFRKTSATMWRVL